MPLAYGSKKSWGAYTLPESHKYMVLFGSGRFSPYNDFFVTSNSQTAKRVTDWRNDWEDMRPSRFIRFWRVTCALVGKGFLPTRIKSKENLDWRVSN